MDRNRKAAFDILLSVEKGAYSNIASNKIITQSRPDDPRFVRELVHGVLSGEIFLDHVLDQLIPSGIKKVKAREKILLRLGLFQIIKAEKIPDYAAVGQTTEMAKKLCRGRDGFVNGVLRGYFKETGSDGVSRQRRRSAGVSESKLLISPVDNRPLD